MATPFGLQALTMTPAAFSGDLPGAGYDPDLQITTSAGRPVVDDPQLLASWGVTWTDTNDKNEK